MRPSKTFLGLAFVLLVAIATTVEAAEDKQETEYCRKARKDCQDKCKDMKMNFECKDDGEGARAAACSCGSSKGSSSASSSSSSSASATGAKECSAAKATAKTSLDREV